MIDPATERLVESRHRVLQLVCLAILSSLAIYVAVAWVVLRQNPEGLMGGDGLPAVLPMILAGVAVMTLLSGEALARMLQARAAGGSSPEERLTTHVNAVIVGFALREAAGVVGLVLTLLTGNLLWVVALAAVAALAMLAGWPRRERLLQLASDLPAPIR